MSRWIRFLFAIIVGVGLGLLYGWVINPVEYIDTMPDTLRQDYQVDYVLMVAEAYQAERDPNLAEGRLSFLGGGSPQEVVQIAIAFASEVGYSQGDLAKLEFLLESLGGRSVTPEETSP